MKTAGIDIGAKTIKVVVLENAKPLAKKTVLAGLETRPALEQVFADALAEAGDLEREDLDCVVGTGAGRGEAYLADDEVTEVTAAARGACSMVPSARTVIDVGAEEGRAIRCNDSGGVEEFAVNERCAAGAGVFTEAMARALEVGLEEFGAMSLRSKRAVPISAQCTVFAESEVVSLIHANTPKEDISRAVHDAIASRITSIVRKVGILRDVVVVGGLALNEGFIDSMQRGLETELTVPDDPEYAGALGAALLAADRAAEGK